MAACDQYDDSITLIRPVEAVRLRPATYVGESHVVNQMLQEALCLSLENAVSGCASEVSIRLAGDGSITVRDNGPPLSIEPVPQSGVPLVQLLLTQLCACRNARKSLDKQFCDVGIIVTNALSEFLEFECAIDGARWRQRYRRGTPEAPLEPAGADDSQYEQIRFRPDRSIVGDDTVDLDEFRGWFVRKSLPLGACRVELIDQRPGAGESRIPLNP